MFRIGIIGAGAISDSHIKSYKANSNCEVAAIADINLEQAQKKATEFGIPCAYSDYNDILNDKTIDAVSVLVPTFLHKDVAIKALASGKHVLCEKPPALNADEVRECVEAAKKAGKLLMYALVARFRNQSQYLKNYIVSGRMGEIISVDIERTVRCSTSGGWFTKKSMAGGGVMFDAAIHDIDLMLYVMGYPKIKSVTGSVSYANRDLPSKINVPKSTWISADTKKYESDVETSASAYITFENGAYLFVKASNVLMTVNPSYWTQICGEKAGARIMPWGDPKLEFVEVGEDNYIREVKPVMETGDPYLAEVNHFDDCCMNGTECICKPEEAIELMKVICAIYESSERGQTIYF